MQEVFMIFSWKSLIDFAVLFLLYRCVFYPRWKKLSKAEFYVRSTMYLYITILLFLTLMPIIASIPLISFQGYEPMFLKPFNDLVHSRGPAEMQIFLNVIMLIPFGFMLPMIKKYNVVQVTLVTFLISLTIEVIQPLLNTYRISDITDVITNTLGGLIGYLLYCSVRPLVNKYFFKIEVQDVI